VTTGHMPLYCPKIKEKKIKEKGKSNQEK